MTVQMDLPELNRTQTQPKVHIETWGCQMNVADSEQMFTLLQKENYQQSQSPEDADLIILNTCHIREKAHHKVLSRLGVLKKIKDHKPGLKIAVAGCVAQAEGERLLKQAPMVDMLLGPGQIPALPSLLKKNHQSQSQEKALGFLKKNEQLQSSPTLEKSLFKDKSSVSRFVNVQTGCNNFCTFCVVPFTRGREHSHRPGDIIAKVKDMVRSGAKEVTLLGQNVNSYGLDLVEKSLLPHTENGPFVDLLRQVVQVPGLQRLRFTTSNPHDMTHALARLFAEFPKLGRYYHLPVQSGSDAILKAMRRKVTVEEYWQKIQWLRESVPDIALSTDLIVGFPGETEEDFQATCALVRKIRYSFIYAFAYSKRKGTAAQRFKEQVPEAVKARRLAELNAIQDAITVELNEQEIGKTRQVLVQYASKKDPHVYYGKTEHYRAVKIASPVDIKGQTVDVCITAANKTALVGQTLSSNSQ